MHEASPRDPPCICLQGRESACDGSSWAEGGMTLASDLTELSGMRSGSTRKLLHVHSVYSSDVLQLS